jgi:CspA family cold shock protein
MQLPRPSLAAMQLPRPSPTGTVKKWWQENGFGFITPDDGSEDAFCHWSSCLDGNEPQDGDKVEYELEWDDRKGKYRCCWCQVSGRGRKTDTATDVAKTAADKEKKMSVSSPVSFGWSLKTASEYIWRPTMLILGTTSRLPQYSKDHSHLLHGMDTIIRGGDRATGGFSLISGHHGACSQFSL